MRWSDDEIRRQFSVMELIRIREGLDLLIREIRHAADDPNDFAIGKEIAVVAELSERLRRLIEER